MICLSSTSTEEITDLHQKFCHFWLEKRTIPQKNVIKLITWSFFVDYHSDLIMVSGRKWGRNLEIDILHINIPKNVSNPLFVGRYSSLKNPRCHLPTACVEYPVSRFPTEGTTDMFFLLFSVKWFISEYREILWTNTCKLY
jgi:hypothetical protein